MERLIGTVSRGVRAPIIRSGDDIAKIVGQTKAIKVIEHLQKEKANS